MNPILITAAVIPAIVLAVKVYKKDKLEREPIGLLISLVLFGIIATALAMVTEKIGTAVLNLFYKESSLRYRLIMYFIVVAVSEEGFKFLLLRIRTWKSPAFNCRFDGVVYAVFVSLGFALWENIGYVIMYGFSTAIIRAVTAVPGHACFGVLMGAFYGVAKKYENYGYPVKSRILRFFSFLLPVLTHGLYDFLATTNNPHYAWIFWAFIIVMFIVCYIIVRKSSKRDEFIA